MTPIGALAVGIFATCTAAAAFKAPSLFSWVLLGIGCVPLVVALWAYIYFALEDPDRLQTEDYRIQKEYVAKLVTYVDGKEIQLDPSQARITENPAFNQGQP